MRFATALDTGHGFRLTGGTSAAAIALGALLFLTGVGLPHPALAHNGAVAIAATVSGIVVDGDLSDWPADAVESPLTHLEYGDPIDDADDFSAWIRVGYDPGRRRLYVGVRVRDQSFTTNPSDPNSWNTQEGCELYLDVGHGVEQSRSVQHTVYGDHSGTGSGDVRHAVERSAAGYVVEWSVDLHPDRQDTTDLALPRSIGFDVSVGDYDEDGSFSWLAWGPGTSKFTEVSRRGDLLLLPAETPLGRIDGTASWAAGPRAAGTAVRLRSTASPALWIQTHTDTAGAWTASLPTGPYHLEVLRHESVVSVAAEPQAPLQVQAPPPRGVTTRLGPGRVTPVGVGSRRGSWQTLTMQDGLPGDAITALHQGPDQRLWIGVAGGRLAAFDGATIHTYGKRDGLPGAAITAIADGPAGQLWLATGEGHLVRLDGDRLTVYTERDGIPAAAVHNLLVVDDVLWLGSHAGLVRFDGDSVRRMTVADGLASNEISVLAPAGGGDIWVGTTRGLHRLDGSVLRAYGTASGLPGNVITALHVDATGALHVATAGGGLARQFGDAFVVEPLPIPTGPLVQAMTQDRQGRLWLGLSIVRLDGSESGTLRIDGDSLTHFGIDRGPVGRNITALLTDREGTVWAGTYDGGLSRYEGERVRSWYAGPDLPAAQINDILRDRQGALWLATDGDGVVRIDDDSVTVFTTEDGLPGRFVRTLLQTEEGVLWAGTSAGVARLVDGRFVTVPTPRALPGSTWDLLQDRTGAVWIASGGKLARVRDGEFQLFDAEQGLVHGDVRCLAEDRDGAIWLGTIQGLSRFRDGVFRSFTVVDGLAHDDVRDLLPGADGSLWVATQGGVSLWDGEGFADLPVHDEAVRSAIVRLAEDRRGAVWMGTRGGVSRYDGEVVQHLTSRDGLAPRSAHALWSDPDGSIWIGGRGGLSRYEPHMAPPSIRLTNVTTDGPRGAVYDVAISSTQRYLAFDLQGVSLRTRPGGLLLRYRLRGAEEDWRTTRERHVEYAGLPVGDYVFEAEAIDSDLNRSPDPVRVAVSVHLPYGQIALWSGLGLAVLALLAAGFGMARRNRQMRQQEARFRGLLELAPDAVIVVDGKGCIVLANARAEQTFGYRREEMLGRPIEMLIPERYRSDHVAKRDGFLAHPTEVQQLELTARRRTGEEFPVEVGLSAMDTDEGRFAFANVRDITDRRRARQALAAAEERSRLLLEAVGEGIIGVDGRGRVTFLNPAAEGLFGFAASDLLGRSLHATLHHSRADGVTYPEVESPLYRAATQGMATQSVEETMWHRDGTPVPVECSATPIGEQSERLGAVITFRDISERKEAESDLRQRTEDLERLGREREARAVQESSLSALARSVQGDLGIALVAERALESMCDFLEAPVGALYVSGDDGQLHRVAARALPPEAESWTSFEVGAGSIGEVARSRRPARFRPTNGTLPLTFGFGRLAAHEVVTQPLVANDLLVGVVELCALSGLDEARSGWLSAACRITASALRTAQQAAEMAAAEERTRLILQSTGDGLFGIDRQGHITFANPAACALLGYEAQALIGRSLHEAVHHTHEDGSPHDAALCPMRRTTRDGEAVTVSDDVLWRRDGTAVPVAYTATPIRKGRDIVGAVISFRDITQRRAAEQAMREARDLAEAAARTKADFLSNMSHEIRTPMNAVIGMAHLALRTDLDPRQRGYVEKIQAAGQHLLGIINDILDFSKIEAGKLEVESIDFELDEVLDNLATLVGDRAADKGLELLFDVDPDLPPRLRGDPLRLGQVLINYANNAVKFTDAGEIVVRVGAVEENDEGLLLRFEVRDSGIGLTEEQMGRLFQSFQQADASTTRQHGGTGLGLAIAKQLAELMGGQVGVDSEVGVGSTFWFTARLGRGQGRRELRPDPDLRGRRVLVVDDNEQARHILTEMLRAMTFHVDEAATGEAALAEVARADGVDEAYDLVLLDWRMPPGIDGVETARRLQAEPLVRRPRLLLVTAYGRDEVFAGAEAAGIAHCLTKPVNPSLLFDAAIRALGGTSHRHGPAAAEQEADDLEAVQGARVLLVEDNLLNQEVARELLGAAGFDVDIAENGQVAVDCVRRQRYEAVLMDMHMPVMDGETATRQIRADARFADLPILAMTANAMEGDRERCLEAGMNDHIPKPIDPDVLFASLRRWILESKGVTTT